MNLVHAVYSCFLHFYEEIYRLHMFYFWYHCFICPLFDQSMHIIIWFTIISALCFHSLYYICFIRIPIAFRVVEIRSSSPKHRMIPNIEPQETAKALNCPDREGLLKSRLNRAYGAMSYILGVSCYWFWFMSHLYIRLRQCTLRFFAIWSQTELNIWFCGLFIFAYLAQLIVRPFVFVPETLSLEGLCSK